MQGSRRFESSSFPIVKSFRIDAGAQITGTATTAQFNMGDMILGFQAKVTEAVVGSGASMLLGFTGQRMISGRTAITSLDAIGDVLGPSVTAAGEAGPYVLTADDTFDCTVSSTTLTAGKFDIHVCYVPAPNGDCDSTFKEYTTT